MPSATYRPQLARLVKRAPDGDDWLHEVKFDGYRIGCVVRDRRVTLISRNGKDWTEVFPEIAREVLALGIRDAVLDGEIAVLLPDGRTSFQALQNISTPASRRALAYFVFDITRLAGENLERRPLEERKAALARLLGRPGAAARVRYSEHVVGRGAAMFEEACRLGLEGIISKRRDAPYTAGRGDTWVKTKCAQRQEFVIGGFTDPEGSRQGLGALLVGHYDADGSLVFAGKVGTGFTTSGAQELRAELNALEAANCPFTPRPAGALGKRAHWVRPSFVAEVTFTEWTGDGKVRHPSFQGLRRDKDPRRVIRDEAGETPASSDPAHRRAELRPRSRRSPAVEVAGVSVSHPDRVVYPALGLTKLQVAQFYERLGRWILPHLADRPLTLVRCPSGLDGGCFYMKHAKVAVPPGTRRVSIQEKTKVGEYLIVDTVPGLVALAQMGILEIHTWNSRADNLEHPDRIVLDLDPGSQVGWPAVVEAGRFARRILDRAGLASFPKTTGGRGLHVVVPLQPAADWEVCLAFARMVAVEMERARPDRYTTKFRKAGREHKILVDYLRNNRTNTSIAAYSTRARPGATVSVPLRWRDVQPTLDPASFTIPAVDARMARLRSDPWADYWRTRQRMPSRA